jgi:hypothetical protein
MVGPIYVLESKMHAKSFISGATWSLSVKGLKVEGGTGRGHLPSAKLSLLSSEKIIKLLSRIYDF